MFWIRFIVTFRWKLKLFLTAMLLFIIILLDTGYNIGCSILRNKFGIYLMFEVARRATGGTDMSNLTIRPINTGFVTMIPKQYLYHHSTVAYYPDASDREEEYPVFTYLVEGGDKLLLVDTTIMDHISRRAWRSRINLQRSDINRRILIL